MTTPDPAEPETGTPTTVTLIVADDVVAAGPAPDRRAQDVPDDFAEHALPFIGKVREIKAKEINLDKLQAAFTKAQAEVGALLHVITHPDVPGFRLSSVDVELSVSAEGSIGVATAGAEASITLSFERDDKAGDGGEAGT